MAVGTSRKPDRGDGSEGFAYVTVLLFMAILVTLSLSFLSRAGIGTAATLNRGSAIQAEYLAEAAVNHAKWRLINEPGFPPAEDKYYMHDLSGGRYGYMARGQTDSTFATIAAVGAIGESVVRRSYVMHLQAAGSSPRMATGSYTGNSADNRAITDVGFRPDVVIVKGDLGEAAVIRTASMLGDLSKKMDGDNAVGPDMIQSLDAGGFTIGNDDAVNKINAAYYWIAFRAVDAEMELGSYVGDESGDLDITGMCFTPALVMVLAAENKEAVFRVNTSPGSFNFDNGGGVDDCIASPFLDDGFRVGVNERVNTTGDVFHYVAWAAIPGQQVSGIYAGDKQDDRDITGLGLQSEFVFVKCASSGQDMVCRTASLGAGDVSMYFAGANASNRIQAILADGFQIGKDNDVNKNGNDYVYFAWAKK